MNEIDKTLVQLLLGASESVDVLAAHGVGFLHRYQDVAAVVDEKLRRRCIITSPSRFAGTKQEGFGRVASQMFQDTGWELRLSSQVPTLGCVIVDRRNCILSPLSTNHGTPAIHISRESPLFSSISEHFERLWTGPIPDAGRNGRILGEVIPEQLNIGYEQLLLSSIPDRAERIIVASNDFWDRQIRYFVEHPKDLRSIDPRQFEELVAELLSRNGLDIELTPRSADGGRDVLAWADTLAGRHLYLVECKRYSASRPVGVEIVRALYGVVQAENATAGLVVATSEFTKGARQFQETIKHRMDLKGYEGLIKWLNRTIET